MAAKRREKLFTYARVDIISVDHKTRVCVNSVNFKGNLFVLFLGLECIYI